MKKLNTPQVSLSELKVPPFLRDLYLDLKDRRMLPVVGLILAAIVAAPFLLGSGNQPAPEAIGPIGGGGEEKASLTVLPSEPGLREPSKRLARLASKDPFKQHFTGPVLKKGSAPTGESAGSGAASVEIAPEGGSGGSGGGGSSGGGAESSPLPSPAPSPGGNEGGGSGGSSGGAGSHSAAPASPGQIQLFTFAVDLKIAHTERTKSGDLRMGKPVIREEVLPPTALPGAKAPVLTYLGADAKDAKKAMMLVSPEVTSVLGDAKCLSGTSSCQLLALEPGLPEIVEYGAGGARYKFEVLKIKPVKTGTTSAPKP